MKQVAFVILHSAPLQWSEMVIINPRHKQLFSFAAERPWLYRPGVQYLLLLLGQG